MLPEAGQGFVALQVRGADADASRPARRAPRRARVLLAERRCATLLGGGCLAPVAAHAVAVPDGRLWLRAWLALPDGSRVAGRTGAGTDPRAWRRRSPRPPRARGRRDRRGGAGVTVYLVGAGPGDPG